MDRKKILYFYTGESSFVKKDIRLLSDQYRIVKRSFSPSQKIFTPLLLISHFFFLLFNIRGSSLIICQFGGYHSFFPTLFAKIFRKPSLIITGGTDCVSFPSINYGVFNKRAMRWFTLRSYKMAAHISPVHESLMLCDYTYQDNDYKKQGLFAFAPWIKTNYTVIYNGYDPKVWFRNKEKVANSFITVCSGLEMPSRKKLKGLDLILEVAPQFPDCSFTIIGVPENFSLGQKSTNVNAIPPLKNNELIDHYNKAEFYLQLSMSEGFPNALCEAMLCECIPIVSNVGAMPDIVGDNGFILHKKDPALLRSLLTKAIADPQKKAISKNAREKIEREYPEQRRGKELLSLIEKMLR